MYEIIADKSITGFFIFVFHKAGGARRDYPAAKTVDLSFLSVRISIVGATDVPKETAVSI